MDLGIEGRKALVFGGSRGMGRAIALALARERVEVTIAARTRETLLRAASELGAEAGIPVAFVSGDITRPEGRQAALAACPAPDILVNNADGPSPGDFRQRTREDWIAAGDAMLFGPIFLIQAD